MRSKIVEFLKKIWATGLDFRMKNFLSRSKLFPPLEEPVRNFCCLEIFEIEKPCMGMVWVLSPESILPGLFIVKIRIGCPVWE